MAIEVHLRNDGPSVTGELRLDSGSQTRTQYGTPVDLPTGSDKIYLLYAQPPGFGRGSRSTWSRATTRSRAPRPSTRSVMRQLVVAVVAERPQGIVAGLGFLPDSSSRQRYAH